MFINTDANNIYIGYNLHNLVEYRISGLYEIEIGVLIFHFWYVIPIPTQQQQTYLTHTSGTPGQLHNTENTANIHTRSTSAIYTETI